MSRTSSEASGSSRLTTPTPPLESASSKLETPSLSSRRWIVELGVRVANGSRNVLDGGRILSKRGAPLSTGEERGAKRGARVAKRGAPLAKRGARVAKRGVRLTYRRKNLSERGVPLAEGGARVAKRGEAVTIGSEGVDTTGGVVLERGDAARDRTAGVCLSRATWLRIRSLRLLALRPPCSRVARTGDTPRSRSLVRDPLNPPSSTPST
jgi:hypothetical protein